MRRRTFLAGAAALAAPNALNGAFAQGSGARAFERTIAYSAGRNGAGLCILRHGVLRAEDYRGSALDQHDIGRATSCFLPALVSALVADRLMIIDEPAALTLSEWLMHPTKSQITLRMLLNQTCGITAAGRTIGVFDAIALEPAAAPGERFLYDDAPIQIFLEIARRKLLQAGVAPDPALYVSVRALARVGCSPVAWSRDPATGDGSFITGARVSTNAWARWGELMRRVGVWRAAQLLDAESLRDACRGSWVQPRYGFGLWLAWPSRDPAPPAPWTDLWSPNSPAPPDLVMAGSETGDRLYILPSQRMVIARQAGGASADWSDSAFLALALAGA